jgi:hypothetical protein
MAARTVLDAPNWRRPSCSSHASARRFASSNSSASPKARYCCLPSRPRNRATHVFRVSPCLLRARSRDHSSALEPGDSINSAVDIGGAMMAWKPDPTFYPSPRLAMQAAPEKHAYVRSMRMLRSCMLRGTSPTRLG